MHPCILGLHLRALPARHAEIGGNRFHRSPMSAQGDAMRAQAAVLRNAAMKPWTGSLPDTAEMAATYMESAATALDQILVLNLLGMPSIHIP